MGLLWDDSEAEDSEGADIENGFPQSGIRFYVETRREDTLGFA